ncbi:hypothetical protein AWM75_00035 [Aerococcus urinaehominis]|uniref:Putative hemin transport system permease protein HrtB n=1 Tax=Aerococcus urinaehominis TaxID=128944 RepID=A0A0X8FJL1_9LACT|nr:ABC transporter permease [Aerococcus urinaehominis]AMB98475.1 hypothetical protein AWM75_00035 [Aerococcus urinaehominis]SDL81674.1 putative ABC transport system permease protein [Aerococcus urinaehominis]
MFLAIKEMKKEKARFLLIISIFVLISYLVYFLVGLANGLAVDNRTAVDQWDASHIILADGTNNNISSSMINQDQLDQDLAGLDYHLLNLSRSAAYINGKETDSNTINITLIGMDDTSEFFPQVIEGDLPAADNEALASASLKLEEGMAVGDELQLSMSGTSFKIVGFTEDYKYNVSPVIYTSLPAASMSAIINPPGGATSGQPTPAKADFAGPDRVSAALVNFSEADSDRITDLEEKYDVITKADFIKEIPGYYAQLLTFGLMISFLIVIAAIVLGVFLYIVTIQKKDIFGIMKIQGISNRYISKSVIVQTFLVSLTGITLGLILTYATEYFLPASVPFRSNIIYYLVISALMLVTSQIGAFFSVRSVSNIDPLAVI